MGGRAYNVTLRLDNFFVIGQQHLNEQETNDRRTGYQTHTTKEKTANVVYVLTTFTEKGEHDNYEWNNKKTAYLLPVRENKTEKHYSY